MKLTKNRYLQGFSVVVLALAILRLIYPQVAEGKHEPSNDTAAIVQNAVDSIALKAEERKEEVAEQTVIETASVQTVLKRDASGKPHRINSFKRYLNTKAHLSTRRTGFKFSDKRRRPRHEPRTLSSV